MGTVCSQTLLRSCAEFSGQADGKGDGGFLHLLMDEDSKGLDFFPLFVSSRTGSDCGLSIPHPPSLLCRYVCPSIWMSFLRCCLPLQLLVNFFIHFFSVSVCLSLSVSVSLCLSLSLSFCLSVCLSVSLSLCVHMCMGPDLHMEVGRLLVGVYRLLPP